MECHSGLATGQGAETRRVFGLVLQSA
jgi:hypothetical protein